MISPGRARKLTSVTAGIPRKYFETLRSSSMVCTLCSKLYWYCQVAFYIDILPLDGGRNQALTHGSHDSAVVSAGYHYGFSLMEVTGLPSGTVYPAMRRWSATSLIRSQWEKQSIADVEQRPPRKYYKLTAAGKAALEVSQKRYPLLARLLPDREEEPA